MFDTGAPIIDLTPALDGSAEGKTKVAHQIGQAFTHCGFMTIVGHGVSEELVDRMRSVSMDYFDLSEEEKAQALSRPRDKQFSGWVPLETDSAAVLRKDEPPPADLRERYRVVLSQAEEVRDHVGPIQWPAKPEEFAAVWQEYYAAIEDLGTRVIRLCALALDLPEDGLDRFFDRHFSVLVASNSPEMKTPPLPGQLRCGEHSDFGTLTFVHQESVVGGLQILTEEGWADVKPVPGAYVVNIGDLMARWTNDRWTSTVHRVANSQSGAAAGARRLSLIYFNQPNMDTPIDCLPTCVSEGKPAKYDTITLREHFSAQQKRLIDKQAQLARS